MGISFIIPVWNRPEYLQMELESLYSQTHIPEQIIIIDDMSDEIYAKQNEEIANKFNVEYYYNGHNVKKKRRAECYNIGLEHAKNNILCFSGGEFVFECNYVERCYSLINKYENMALATITYGLPFIDFLKSELEGGETLKEISYSPPIYYDSMETLNTSTYICESSNPHPTHAGFFFDGITWLKRKFTINNAIWDSDVIGWGLEQRPYINNLLLSGLSLCVTRDIYTFHIAHGKDDTTAEAEYLEGMQILLEKWSGKTIPVTNDLIKIKGELQCYREY